MFAATSGASARAADSQLADSPRQLPPGDAEETS
jgi:hypothetical protein